MQNNSQSKFKAYLPYLIIIGVAYLIVPALLLTNVPAVTYIVLIGLLPLTALVSCAHYSMHHGNDFVVCVFAPLFFVITMLLYRLVQTDPLRAFIYLLAYFLCSYLGLTIGDILANRGSSAAGSSRPARPAPRPRQTDDDAPYERAPRPEYTAPSTRARRVNVDAAEQPAPARRPAAQPRAGRVDVDAVEEPRRSADVDLYDDSSLDQSTTSDDIDAILREIHQRRGE